MHQNPLRHGGANRTRVLIVGAGPAGLAAAITLSSYGIPILLVEKRKQTATMSRALVISTRSMEIFRAWGLEEAIRAGAADVEPRGWRVSTLSSEDGTEFALGHPTSTEAKLVSPTRPACAPQDHLEPILLAHLRTFRTAELSFGSELVDLEQDEHAVRARIHDHESGGFGTIEAEYVIGADGAHSTVRARLGIRMDGTDDLGDFQRVEFRAPLTSLIRGPRCLLNITTNPEAAGVFAPRGPGDLWGFSREVRQGERGLVDMSEDQLMSLLARAAGAASLQAKIERRWNFRFAAQLAERYRERRIFLVGDAGHRVTPRGGTGMNTAIHDAFDVGWKLAWVLHGWSAAGLLDTYENERRPVGEHNVQRSANPDGARQDPKEAIPWDLNGRIAHHWLQVGHQHASTLDLVGAGLTVLADAGRTRWPSAVAAVGARAPVTLHVLEDDAACRAIGVPRSGALVVRPDGRVAAEWTDAQRPPALPDTLSLVDPRI